MQVCSIQQGHAEPWPALVRYEFAQGHIATQQRPVAASGDTASARANGTCFQA